jgi:hypothetical protein
MNKKRIVGRRRDSVVCKSGWYALSNGVNGVADTHRRTGEGEGERALKRMALAVRQETRVTSRLC